MGPRLYSPSSQCRWHVKVEDQAARKIAFYIRMFRTERSSKCDRNNDNLVIFDAPDCNTETLQTAPVWGSLCGYKRRGHFFTKLKQACFLSLPTVIARGTEVFSCKFTKNKCSNNKKLYKN